MSSEPDIAQNEIIEVISLHPDKIKDKKYYTIGYHPWWTLDKLSLDELNVFNLYK